MITPHLSLFRRSTLLGLTLAVVLTTISFAQNVTQRPPPPVLKKGEKQLFVDSVMLRSKQGVMRVVHPAKKREQPVLRAEMPWEVRTADGVVNKRVNIYGTVLRDEKTGTFRMWYADAGGDRGIAPSVARPEPGIGAITVGGNIDHTFILAGYNQEMRDINADVQIGVVRVSGDWIASYLTAGAKPGGDGLFGTADDRPLLGGEHFGAGPVRDNLSVSKIASIVIAGQVKDGTVRGLPGTDHTFGFVAEDIGSFTHGGLLVPLTAGASIDTFTLGKARPVGPSRSSLNADGLAIHVFEV